jgi:hypothetical protein
MSNPHSRPLWLSRFVPGLGRQGRRRRRASTLRALEPLEDRTVLSSISVGPGDTPGLYAAIAAANTATGPATVNIHLSPGTYMLNNGELDITATSHQVMIHGNGAVIDAQGNSRVLETDTGTDVTLQDLELTNGLVTGTLAQGGGILNLGGNLSLNDVVVDHDEALGSKAIHANTGGAAQGGGLFTDGGSVLILNSKLSNDTAQGGTGGPGGRGVAPGAGGAGQGGGLYAGGGSVSILNTTVSMDAAQGGPGGGASNHFAGAGQGGGLYAGGGSIALTNSSVTDNTASRVSGGGGIFEVVVPTLTNTTVNDNTPDDIS